jgi:hypothetical protein
VEEPGDIDKILTKMKKNEDEKDLALVGETYLH